MAFWILAALMTLGACLAVLVPATRREPGSAPLEDAHDLEVYRDQLAEIERDAARRMITPAEAELARAEIGRRILAITGVSGRPLPAKEKGSGRAARIVATCAVLMVPIVSWGLYVTIGAPAYSSQPMRANVAPAEAGLSLEQLVARAEAHLAENPDDARGWDVLAPVYLRMGRFAEAENAYRRSIALAGETSARLVGLGKALAGAAGRMDADAREALERALALEPQHIEARYLLALADAQQGDAAAAQKAWQDLLGGLPEDSPWRATIEAALAWDGSGEQRMVEEMVASLARRLEREPDDVDGWQRLIRSYVVMGRREDATAALEAGQEALGRGGPEAAHLEAFALSLGIGNEE